MLEVLRSSYTRIYLVTIVVLFLVVGAHSHVVNQETLVQSSADSGSHSSGDTGWTPLMSKGIETTGGPILVDFHATTRGCSHHTWGFRTLVNGSERGTIRQTDSDGDNQKMAHMYDVVNVSEGYYNVEVEWRLYSANTYQTNYNRDECEAQSGIPLKIHDEASLNLVELNSREVGWSVENSSSGSSSGTWTNLLSDTYTVEDGDGAIMFRGFTSAHSFNEQPNTWYRTRLLVNGNEVSYSRTAESNNGYSVSSLLQAGNYSEGEQLNVELQWRDEGYQFNLDGATARLGIFEFKPPVDFKKTGNDAGTAPGGWGELDSLNIETNHEYIFSNARISADVANDNDYYMRMNLDGGEVASQSTGVSDDSASDTIFVSSLDEVESGTHSLKTEWETEGSTEWEDSELVALGLRNSTLDLKICDLRGASNQCISEERHDLEANSFKISSVFKSLETSLLTSSGGRATINVTNSSEISGTWKGVFSIFSEPKPLIKPGAEFRPKDGNIVIGE